MPVQLPPHSGSPRRARHDLVLGSGTTIKRNSTQVNCVHNSTETVKQQGVSQQPTVSQPLCLVCSEIHTWVANKVSNLGKWEKVAFFPNSHLGCKQGVEPWTMGKGSLLPFI